LIAFIDILMNTLREVYGLHVKQIVIHLLIEQHFKNQVMELLVINLIQALQKIANVSLLFLKTITSKQAILLHLSVLLDFPTLLLNLLHLLRVN